MKIKLLVPAVLLATGALVSCGKSESPTTFTITSPTSGLGAVDVNETDNGTYELVVTPIEGIQVEEVKINDEVVELTNNTCVFNANAGQNNIHVTYTEPEAITLDLALNILELNYTAKTKTHYDYIYRSAFLNNETLEPYSNISRKYQTNFYSNGVHAEVTLSTPSGMLYTDEEGYQETVVTTGDYVLYKVNEERYMRALVPEVYHDDGFAQLLERNYYFDETTEDLGYLDAAQNVHTNLTFASLDYPEELENEISYPSSYGYVHSQSVVEDEDAITFSLLSHADATEDGYYAEENHSHNLVIDKETYEVKALSMKGKINQTDGNSPVVTIDETCYDNIAYGEKTVGEIPTVEDTSTIDPDYVEIHEATIQEDIADGELSKEDAARVLNNIWAYSENTHITTASGAAYMYDEDYNEIPGTSDMTITAYKDYFLVTENVFTPDDTETYGESITSVVQKSVRPEGIANITIVDGVVSEMNSYLDWVGAEYNMEQNFSASPLKQDWSLGMIVNEAVSYNLTTFHETNEWGAFGMVYDNFSATKDGEDITIKWSVATTYGTIEEADPAIYIQIVITDNFVTEMSYGDSFEDCLTYHMTQAEYPEFTGTVYDCDLESVAW